MLPHLREYLSFASNTVSVVVELLSFPFDLAEPFGFFALARQPVLMEPFSQLNSESPQPPALKPCVILGLRCSCLLDRELLCYLRHLATLRLSIRLKIGSRPTNLIPEIHQLSMTFFQTRSELSFLLLDRFFSPTNSDFVFQQRCLLRRHRGRLDPQGILFALRKIVCFFGRHSWQRFDVFHDLAFSGRAPMAAHRGSSNAKLAEVQPKAAAKRWMPVYIRRNRNNRCE
jgi:hypothetical protein